MPKAKRTRKRKQRKKIQESNKRNKYLMIAGVVLLAGYWALVQYQEGAFSNYPNFIEAVTYTNPTISNGKVSIPDSFLDENKLVYIDIELDEAVEEFTYLGRVIPLGLYEGGEYLPLVIISTPKGDTFSGIRVCEPCASFSFHIVQKKYLQCDACGTRWDIETMEGISGGCEDFPPPSLPVTDGNQIEINVATTGLILG